MREAVVYVILAVLSVTLASFVSYSPGERWGRTALGIILLSSLLAPTLGMIGGLADITLDIPYYGEEGYGDPVGEVAGEAFCDGVRVLVCEEFGLTYGHVSVRTSGFRMSDMSAEKIYITLRGTAALADSRAISEYVSVRMGCECEVNITFE